MVRQAWMAFVADLIFLAALRQPTAMAPGWLGRHRISGGSRTVSEPRFLST